MAAAHTVRASLPSGNTMVFMSARAFALTFSIMLITKILS
jgi:hypothetical protein